ncbi:hypothetical protein AcW1_003918 [Taiwanofungus camphoratus]|nr:hypothetical protein AcW1_003918 [Antrodia cinnamomea]
MTASQAKIQSSAAAIGRSGRNPEVVLRNQGACTPNRDASVTAHVSRSRLSAPLPCRRSHTATRLCNRAMTEHRVPLCSAALNDGHHLPYRNAESTVSGPPPNPRHD